MTDERERVFAYQAVVMKAVLTDFSGATEELWKVLQLEVRRGRAAICTAIAHGQGRWAALGERGPEIAQTLSKALMDGPRDWFAEATKTLDLESKPYVLLVLDVETRAGVMNGPDTVSTLWRSTLSRGAAIQALRGLAMELEQRPELLEDADEPS